MDDTPAMLSTTSPMRLQWFCSTCLVSSHDVPAEACSSSRALSCPHPASPLGRADARSRWAAWNASVSGIRISCLVRPKGQAIAPALECTQHTVMGSLLEFVDANKSVRLDPDRVYHLQGFPSPPSSAGKAGHNPQFLEHG